MKFRKSTAILLLCALAISGCGTASGGSARPDRDGSVLADNGGSVPPDISELAQSDDFRPIENTGIFISFCTDEEAGLELQYSPGTEGEYRIVCEGQETFWELGAAPEDIRDIEIQPWGEEGLFLVLTAALRDRTTNTFILNKEMVSEVMIQDPCSTAKDSLDCTVVEEENLILLGEGGFRIECGDDETLSVLEKNMWISDEVRYGVEEGNCVCHVPVCIGPDDEIGAVRLSYEYDGVGMNCIDQKFIPAD